MIDGLYTLFLSILFFIFAIFLSNGKGAFLIAGYNTMSESEKEKFDELAFCKFFGKCMFGLSFSILLWAVSQMLDIQVLFIIDLILFWGIIMFLLVYSNTGDRFMKKDR